MAGPNCLQAEVHILRVRSSKAKSIWKTTPPSFADESRTGDILCADALKGLSWLADASVDLVFLDPPFNLGKSYGSQGKPADRIAERDYFEYMLQVLDQSVRILKPGGALYMYHIPKWAIRFAPHLSATLTFRHWIAISMKNGFVRGNGLYPAHYALLYFTKGTPTVARRPKILPATCPHCDEYVKDYGGHSEHIENGVNLSDVWDDLSPVRHAKYKNRAANELPLKLASRVLDISGVKGGFLVDPFAGTGTTVMAARASGMKFVAIDRESENCRVIISRLQSVTSRRTKVRGAGKP